MSYRKGVYRSCTGIGSCLIGQHLVTNPIEYLLKKGDFFWAQSVFAFLKNVDKQELNQFIVEILSIEGLESSQIEEEIIDRGSLQSSINQHLGIQTNAEKKGKKNPEWLNFAMFMSLLTIDYP